MDSERTYLLWADEIHRLREQRGISLGELAERCEVDRKTLRRWLKGKPAYMANIARLADVLRTTPDQLIVAGVTDPPQAALVPVASGAPGGEPGPRKRRRKLTVAIFQFEDFDDAAEKDFLLKLAKAMGTERTLEVIDVEPANSILVTLELDPEDDEKLVKAFVTGKLAPLGVTRLQDADTGEDVTGAMIDGMYVHVFSPNAGPTLTTEIHMPPAESPKKVEKKD